MDSAEDGTMKVQRFSYFANKYGFVHAVIAGVGRYSQALWAAFAPTVTRRYVHRYLKESHPSYVNLGAGSHRLEDMLNVDISPYSDAWVDLTKPIPFESNSVDYVFSEEVIEHLDREHGFEALMEIRRILKPGGTARLSTPRLEYFVDRFHSSDQNGEAFNWIFYEHEHKHIYTEASIQSALLKAGFSQVRLSTYRDPVSHLAKYDSHADRYGHEPNMSLYVEGTK